MPPVAILAAATIGSAAIGAGANIAAAGANAKAAQSTAAANAAQINATRASDESLLAQQQSANQRFFDEAKGNANTDIINGANSSVGALNGAHDANAGVFQDAYGRSIDAAKTLQGQGEGLYGATAARGNDAGSAINALLGIGGDASAQEAAFNNWLGSTGYNFTMKSGSDAIASNAATKGLIGSGGTLKALNNYGQQTGQTYFGNYLQGLQGQQATGLTAANALSGVYGNVAGLKTNAANTLSNGLATNNTNTANALSGVYTGQGQALAGIAQNYATGLQGLQTGLTNGLVAGNAGASAALTANNNNALSQQVSSNNSAANGISGLAGNVISGIAYGQGQSSYGAAPNALAATGSPTSILGGPSVASNVGSSYSLNTNLPNVRI